MSTQQPLAWVQNGKILVRHPYDANFVTRCRAIPGRWYDGIQKLNRFPAESVDHVKALCDEFNISIDDSILTLEAPTGFGDGPHVTVNEKYVLVKARLNQTQIDRLRQMVPAIVWRAAHDAWCAPHGTLGVVLAYATEVGLDVQAGVRETYNQDRQNRKELHDLSTALESDIEIKDMANGYSPWPFQRAGIEYLTRQRRAILGDEMGLGKTLQGFATVINAGTFPCVVACTKTMKFKLPAELEKFYPNYTYTILEGRTADYVTPSDFIFVNYDIIAQRVDDILMHKPQALLMDEAHRIANGRPKYFCPECGNGVKSNTRNCSKCRYKMDVPREQWNVKRCDGVMQIANYIRAKNPDGVIIPMTGTPWRNRNMDFFPLLAATGRLDEFGGRWGFEKRYHPGGEDSNSLELSRRLRELCYIRREKHDVEPDLPPLQNNPHPLSVDQKKWKKYVEIENDVVGFLAKRAKEIAEEAGQDGNAAYIDQKLRAEAAEHLVRISTLKNAVSELKYDSIIDWIDDFFEENDTGKLIFYAEHVSMVEAVYEHYQDRAVKIRGGVSAPDRLTAEQSFQNDPNVRLIVMNMASAAEGLTLTAASHVVFAELAWTPAEHEQCAARCFGRLNDMHGATAHYLLVPHSIDQDIYSLLQSKAQTMQLVASGGKPSKSVLGDLIVSLAHRQEERKS